MITKKSFLERYLIVIIIIIICQSSRFWASALLKRFCQILSGFHFFGYRSIFFLWSKVVSFTSNPQPGGPGLCICVPQWHGSPIMHPITGFPFLRLLRLAGLRCMYSNSPPWRIILIKLWRDAWKPWSLHLLSGASRSGFLGNGYRTASVLAATNTLETVASKTRNTTLWEGVFQARPPDCRI
jgi:hypothetical protein